MINMAVNLGIVSFFLVILSFALNWFLRGRRLSYFASKFDGPPSLPLIGSAFYLIGGNERILKNIVYLAKKYKSPWKIWLGTKLYVVVTDPEDIEIVSNQALEKATNYNFMRSVLGEGLFTGPVEKWKRHRKVILATFSMPILNSFVEVFSEQSQMLVKILENFIETGFFDAFPIITQAAVEITCETVMGKRAENQTPNSKFVKNFAKAMELISYRMFHYWVHPNLIWRLSPHSKKLEELSIINYQFVKNIITEKKLEYRSMKQNGYFEGDSRRRKCFLDHLIELSEKGKSWPDEELMEEAQTMIAAGSESIGSTVSYTLIMLGMHPSIQNKVYKEIFDIYRNDDRHTTPEDLLLMVYLEQVIKEILRLFPVAGAVGRRVDHDIVTSSYTIPGGCECIIGILHVHRNPEIWPDPLKFKPERFAPEESSKRHPYSYVPFSGGPRNCIGFKYAVMAVKTLVSTILRNYTISTEFATVSDIQFAPSVVLKAKKGFRIAIKRRY